MKCGGHAVIDGLRMPITGMSLQNGMIVFWASMQGPMAASGGIRPVTIFGEDGLGICQGDVSLSWPDLSKREVLKLSITMTMKQCYGDGERS